MTATPPVAPRNKSPKSYRVFLFIASVLLTMLLLWFWSFILNDIDASTMPQRDDGPKTEAVQVLEKQRDALQEKQSSVSANINDLEANQRLLKDSTNSTRDTMNQLLQNQKQLAEKNIALSPQEQEAIAQSQKLFLDNQKQYQNQNQEIASQTIEKQRIGNEIDAVQKKLEPLYREYDETRSAIYERAQIKAAALQFAILLPLFLIAFWLVVNKRNTAYGILIYPLAISLFLKMLGVIHEYFPTRYFKYIALLGLIAAICAFMIYLIRLMKRPRPELIRKQIRESYEKRLCAECSYPIQRGWVQQLAGGGKATPKIIAVPATGEPSKQEPYSCPSCGQRLYEECAHCHETRHSLLPFCEHCGSEKMAPQAD